MVPFGLVCSIVVMLATAGAVAGSFSALALLERSALARASRELRARGGLCMPVCLSSERARVSASIVESLQRTGLFARPPALVHPTPSIYGHDLRRLIQCH